MKKTYILKDTKITDSFFYSYSPICKKYEGFNYEDDCIVNSVDSKTNGYDYISILSKEKLKDGDTIQTKCSFEKFGAPLIVISNDIRDVNGRKQYGLHFEIVAWENGCNVWHIIPYPERTERPINPTLIGKEIFKIEDNSPIDISVCVKNKELIIDVNGHFLKVSHEDIPETFYAGITACEGINRFYELSIENK